jgi:hypothetical protein
MSFYFYFYQILTGFNRLKIMSEMHYYQILTVFNRLKIMSEVALLLPNTDPQFMNAMNID